MGKMSRKNLHELFIFIDQLVNVLDAIRDIMPLYFTPESRSRPILLRDFLFDY